MHAYIHTYMYIYIYIFLLEIIKRIRRFSHSNLIETTLPIPLSSIFFLIGKEKDLLKKRHQ